MTQTQPSELIKTASEFVELMREDFERAFELIDFIRYARFKLGYDVDEGEVERVAFDYFGKHYDLVRWDICAAWSFIPELEAPEPPELR